MTRNDGDWAGILKSSSHNRPVMPPIPVAFDPSNEVVVADASDLVRRAVLRLLDGRYLVRPVSDGQQALAYLERNPNCTLVMGLRMSPMDGPDLLAHIAERWPERLRKVVVMTGWPDPHRWVPPGVIVLQKPATPEVILAVIEGRIAEKIPGRLDAMRASVGPEANDGCPSGVPACESTDGEVKRPA